MPPRVMAVVALSVFAVVFLPWNVAASYLEGTRALLTLAWWRREARNVALRARAVKPRVFSDW